MLQRFTSCTSFFSEGFKLNILNLNSRNILSWTKQTHRVVFLQSIHPVPEPESQESVSVETRVDVD